MTPALRHEGKRFVIRLSCEKLRPDATGSSKKSESKESHKSRVAAPFRGFYYLDYKVSEPSSQIYLLKFNGLVVISESNPTLLRFCKHDA